MTRVACPPHTSRGFGASCTCCVWPESRTLDQPGFRLHPLRGKYQDHWSVTVSANWRIVFRFEVGEVVDVDFVDYH